MKTILIATLIATAAPAADAGDWSFGISLGSRNRIELRTHRHREISTHHRVFVPGHYDTHRRAVHVPARYERRYFRAEFGIRYDACGNRIRVVVRPAGYRNVLVRAAHTDYVSERHWVAGYWKVVDHRRDHRVSHRGHQQRRHDRHHDRHRNRQHSDHAVRISYGSRDSSRANKSSGRDSRSHTDKGNKRDRDDHRSRRS
ncbi:MAG: hypothetical protein V3T86_14580 [Planctomycetota bacterium]